MSPTGCGDSGPISAPSARAHLASHPGRQSRDEKSCQSDSCAAPRFGGFWSQGEHQASLAANPEGVLGTYVRLHASQAVLPEAKGLPDLPSFSLLRFPLRNMSIMDFFSATTIPFHYILYLLTDSVCLRHGKLCCHYPSNIPFRVHLLTPYISPAWPI